MNDHPNSSEVPGDVNDDGHGDENREDLDDIQVQGGERQRMAAAMTRLEAIASPELTDRWIKLREALHRKPEMAFEEFETSARLEQELRRLQPESIERFAGTGLVARFAGEDRDAPVVALRGDIDGLPIHEATGVSFASEIDGRMHACGHDVHSAWAFGAAELISREPAHGDVWVFFQPAEEKGAGAQRMIDEGALEGVQAIFGGHVDSRFEVGQVVAQPGPLAASVDTFRITLRAEGSHGARPHQSADPIVGAAALVGALQTIVSRRIDPAAAAVVTVGSIHGGVAPNVIPDSVSLQGTLRAMRPDVRTQINRGVDEIARSVAASYKLGVDVEFDAGPPPLINHEREAVWARQAVEEVLGMESIRPFGVTNMAGEDFAAYLQEVPGAFLRIGCRAPGQTAYPPHSPKFLPADEAIAVGAAVLAGCARHASTRLAGSLERRCEGR